MIVDLGVQVTIFDARASAECQYCIVAPHLADPAAGRLSSESPVARALRGRSSGDTVVVTTPGGRREMRILSLA